MISLWEYWAFLTWEDKGIFDNLRHFVCRFQALKGPRGSPMVLNGQTSVPWEVEIKYSTMGWYHYGNTERYLFKRCSKEYLMIWGIFLLFSVIEGPLKGHLGSQMVLNRQTSVPWEVEIKYSTMGWFHYGNFVAACELRNKKNHIIHQFCVFCFSFVTSKLTEL